LLKLLKRKERYGLWALAFGLLARWVFNVFPDLCEVVYGQAIFPLIRIGFDYTFGLLPFPAFYLFFVFLAYKFFKSIQTIGLFKSHFLKKILNVINFWAWLLFAFLMVWGYNYQRPEIKDRLSFKDIQLRSNAFDRMMESSIKRLSSIDYSSVEYGSQIEESGIDEIRIAQEAFLMNLGYSDLGRAQVNRLVPKGIFRRFGISGMYLPWIGQGNVDASLSNLEYPFIAAHEMAHAYGVTNEGEASFAAFMTCWGTKNDRIRYSAEIYLIRNILHQLKNRNPEQHQKWLGLIPPKVKYDIQKIKDNVNAYPDLFPVLSDKVNDTYLKSQGIESGSKSYGELIALLYSWEFERVRN